MKLIARWLGLALSGFFMLAQAATPVPVPKPVMGWASWNTFASKIDFNTIKAQVDAMVAAGLPAAGYQYVNLDEGWWLGQRDANGNMTVDATQWPGGMTAIVDYIHGKGLKAGIYTDAGKNGCGFYFPTPSSTPAYANTGIEGHEAQDMLQFQRWGFDFVKVDWCGGDVEHLDPKATYQRISDANRTATATTGRTMLLSMCNWGNGQPWNFGASMAPMWRTSTDIIFFGNAPSVDNMLQNFDRGLHPVSQHTGHVNDPDMLMVGMPGFSDAQNRLHLGLWAISGAPLIAGNNLAQMSAATRATLTQRSVLDIDQDALGLQGFKVAEDTLGLQVYMKILSGSGQRAVLLLNRNGAAASIAMRWTDMGLTGASASVRDAWSGASLGSFANGTSLSVPARDARLLLLSGTESAATGYEAEATGNTLAGGAVPASCQGCSGGSRVGHIGRGGSLAFKGVNAAAAGLHRLDIDYLNGDAGPRSMTLQVNGQQATVLSLPPTGSWSAVGRLSVIVSLRQGAVNQLTLSNAADWAPDIDAISVQPMAGAQGVALAGSGSGRCVDIPDNSIVAGTQATLWDCHGGVNQTFTRSPRGELVVYGNQCLDADHAGTTNGTKVMLWGCNGQANQQWNLNANGTVTNRQSGLCLDAAGAGIANGTPVQLWSCTGAANQKWAF